MSRHGPTLSRLPRNWQQEARPSKQMPCNCFSLGLAKFGYCIYGRWPVKKEPASHSLRLGRRSVFGTGAIWDFWTFQRLAAHSRYVEPRARRLRGIGFIIRLRWIAPFLCIMLRFMPCPRRIDSGPLVFWSPKSYANTLSSYELYGVPQEY